MKASERKHVVEVIDQEGFLYTFKNYTDFDDIEDEKFHTLRLAFLRAAERLQDYLERGKTGR